MSILFNSNSEDNGYIKKSKRKAKSEKINPFRIKKK